jgi:hypothetical protein
MKDTTGIYTTSEIYLIHTNTIKTELDIIRIQALDLVHDLTCQKSSIGVIVLTAILSISLNLDVLSTILSE